jgi:hypothetical protein
LDRDGADILGGQEGERERGDLGADRVGDIHLGGPGVGERQEYENTSVEAGCEVL